MAKRSENWYIAYIISFVDGDEDPSSPPINELLSSALEQSLE